MHYIFGLFQNKVMKLRNELLGHVSLFLVLLFFVLNFRLDYRIPLSKCYIFL